MRELITYILTDSVKEFCHICDELGLQRTGSRLLGNQNAYWISRWDQILGRRIFSDDNIIWGSFNDLEQWNKICTEIAIRIHIEKGK